MTTASPSLGKIKPPRTCFVTIGATAGFRQLLQEVVQPAFLACLASYGYRLLQVQCGPDAVWFEEHVKGVDDSHGIKVESFQYTTNMKNYMLACRGERAGQPAGCIISHAGSGTILEALRYDAPLIVVPNPTLMDNHQAELAEECAKQDWAVCGKLSDLVSAVHRSHQRVAKGRLEELPPYSPPPFPVQGPERLTVLDWMVLTCYPAELKTQLHLRELQDVTSPVRQENEGGRETLADLYVD